MRRGKLSLIFLPIVCVVLTSCGDNNKDDWGIDKNESGGVLLEHLHQICLEKHTNYVLYGDFRSYVIVSKKDQTSIDMSGVDNTKNELFYTEKRIANTSGDFNREHVWACADSNKLWTHDKSDGVHYVDSGTYRGGGSDLFHVRPVSEKVNTARGNAKLYEFQDGETYYTVQDDGPSVLKVDQVKSGEPVAKKFEPADSVKGDVARVLMYVYTHYSNIGDNTKYIGTPVENYLGLLKFTDVFNSTYSLDQCKQLLVKWNNLDPVSETEKLRNDTVEKIQGNRNPYVDHPEYMARCFELDE